MECMSTECIMEEIQKHEREYKKTRGNTKIQKREYKIKRNTKEGVQNKQGIQK